MSTEQKKSELSSIPVGVTWIIALRRLWALCRFIFGVYTQFSENPTAAFLAVMIWLALRLGPWLIDRNRRSLILLRMSKVVSVAYPVLYRILVIVLLWLQTFFG